ncbi:MAG: hypothetical protein V1712_03050 [Patescibacteria group bacterium]
MTEQPNIPIIPSPLKIKKAGKTIKITYITIASLIICSILIFIFYKELKGYTVLYSNILLPSSHSEVKREIINKIKTGLESLTTYSWQTKFGRIYAQKCSGPPYDNFYDIPKCMTELDLCADGGTSFYNSIGFFITNCDGMPSPFEKDSPLCDSFFDKLSAKKADFTSEVDYNTKYPCK